VAEEPPSICQKKHVSPPLGTEDQFDWW